jgi:hypothetical protein
MRRRKAAAVALSAPQQLLDLLKHVLCECQASCVGLAQPAMEAASKQLSLTTAQNLGT